MPTQQRHINPVKTKLSYRAGFFEGDAAFEIFGVAPADVTVPKFVMSARACLTRGAPTRPSPRLEEALGFDWAETDKSPLYLTPSEKLPVWRQTILGAANGNNPALQFFEQLLPKKLGSWGFVTGLMVPEYELFAMLYAPDSLAPGTKAGRVDFYLPQAALAIEIDGSQHQKKIASTVDKNRDQFLARHGIRTIRIPTDDIRKNGASLQKAIDKMVKIFGETPELQAHAKIRSSASPEILRYELVAAARLQLTLVALIRSGDLSLKDRQWDLTVTQDFAAGANLKWAQAAVTDLLEWFDCFAGIYREDFTAPTVNWSDEGHRLEILLHKRADESLSDARHTLVTTAAVQFLPQESSSVSRADPEPKPDPVALEDLPSNLSDSALERLNRMVFGHKAFRHGQLDLIKNIFSGSNTLGLMPTGAGKSLAFQFPGLLCPGTTIVVVPIRALGRDHTAELDAYGFAGRSVNIDSGTSAAERAVIYRKMVQGCFRFVFVSPERFQTADFKEVVKATSANHNLNFFAVDEAHCLSEWGHDFRPSYLTLPSTLRALGPKTPVICVTATAAVNTLKDLQSGFNISDEMVSYEMDRGRPELTFGVAKTKSVMTDLFGQVQTNLSKFSGKGKQYPPGLIFSPYVNGDSGALSILTELAIKMPDLRLALFTGSEPQNVDVGDLIRLLRDKHAKAANFEEYKIEVQNRWKRGQIDLVVATKAFGMGVNKADVRFTLHAGMPSSMEAFYQEAGRAGRDGESASGKILFKRETDQKQDWFQKVLKSPQRSIIETQLENVGRRDRGDLRAQLWFLNNSNSDITIDLKRLQRIRATLPVEGGVTVINRNDHKPVIGDGHYFQVSLFRLYQLGIVSSWSVEDWGVGTGGVAVVEAHSEPLNVEFALNSFKERVEAITGKGDASLARIEQVQPGILSEANPDNAWDRVFYELLSWVQQSQLRSRLISMKKLYDECIKFTPANADLFKKQLENYFIIDQDSLALADLKDLTLEDAVGSIMAALLSPQGRLKPPAALRKLEAQAARLRQGTSENPALNLVAGILQLVTGPNESSGWQQLMWSATGEAGSHHFWFGAGRPVLEKLTETDQLVAEAMARFLLIGEQTLSQLSEVNQFFKSELTRVFLLGALADKLAEEI